MTQVSCSPGADPVRHPGRGRFSITPLLRIERVAAIQGLGLRNRNRRYVGPANPGGVSRMEFVHGCPSNDAFPRCVMETRNDRVVLLRLPCP